MPVYISAYVTMGGFVCMCRCVNLLICNNECISGVTTPGQDGPEAMAMKEHSAFPKAPALLEPQHQIVWCHI